MFQGQYPPFKLDSDGALLVAQDESGGSTPVNLSYQYPPFSVNENGAILMAIGS